MAALTDQLSSVNSGKPIINPGPANPSFLGALAGFAADAVPGIARLGAQRQQARAEAALDDVEGRTHDLMAGYQAAAATVGPPEIVQSGPPPIDGSLAGSGLPSDAVSAANDLQRAQRARDQGRISQGTLDLQIERLTTEMYQKYPDMRNEIGTYMQSRGFSHYMYREARAAGDLIVAERDSQTAALTTQFQYAASRGLVTNDTALVAGAQVGRQAMESQARLEAAQAAAAAAQADATLAAGERENILKGSTADAQTAIMAQVATAVGPLTSQVTLALSAAGTDPERQTLLSEYRVKTQAALTAQRARAIQAVSQAGGGADARKEVGDFFDNQISSLDNLFTTSFEQNSLASRNLGAAFNLNGAQANVAYSTMVGLIGQPAVNALLADPSGVIQLPPETIAAMRGELQNFDPTDPRGAVSLARVMGYLRRENGLEDLSAETAQAMIRTNTTVQLSGQREVLAGNTASVRPYLNAATNTAEAMVEMAPTATSLASLKTATGLNSTPAARQALAVAVREDPEYGRAVATASRNGAAKALDIARNTRTDTDGPFETFYNADTRRYEQRVTDAAYRTWAARQPRGSNASSFSPNMVTSVPSIGEVRARVPQSIQDRLIVMNANLEHLVQTQEYDPTMANIRGNQARELFAEGRMPSTGTQSQNAPDADAAFNTLLQNLDTTLQDVILGSTAPTAPNSDFNSLDWVVRTVYGEASGEGPAGWAPVAATIFNRAEHGGFGGSTYRDVVRARRQYEPWNNATARRRMEALSPDSPQYQEILRVVQATQADRGQYARYTHFYAPEAQRALGRNAPNWDDGTGTDIGNHRFFVNPGRRND